MGLHQRRCVVVCIANVGSSGVCTGMCIIDMWLLGVLGCRPKAPLYPSPKSGGWSSINYQHQNALFNALFDAAKHLGVLTEPIRKVCHACRPAIVRQLESHG